MAWDFYAFRKQVVPGADAARTQLELDEPSAADPTFQEPAAQLLEGIGFTRSNEIDLAEAAKYLGVTEAEARATLTDIELTIDDPLIIATVSGAGVMFNVAWMREAERAEAAMTILWGAIHALSSLEEVTPYNPQSDSVFDAAHGFDEFRDAYAGSAAGVLEFMDSPEFRKQVQSAIDARSASD
jgi:hypothetical protein